MVLSDQLPKFAAAPGLRFSGTFATDKRPPLLTIFLPRQRLIRPCTSGSALVWRHMVRVWRELPSSISTLLTTAQAWLGSCPRAEIIFGVRLEKSVAA
jgi:hypothetical protein